MGQLTSGFHYYERGRVLKQNQMFDEALDEFLQAATDPQYAGKAYVQMALCLRATERGEAAVAAFRRALEFATFSSKEKAHILYLLGQTLESLGRYAEALEAYGWARNEDPGFQDAGQRIKHLISGGRGPLPQHRPAYQSWVASLCGLWRQLISHVLPRLGKAWKSFKKYAEKLGSINGAEDRVSASETGATRADIGKPRRRDAIRRRHGTARETNVSTSALQSECAGTFRRGVGWWPVRESCETFLLGAVVSRVLLPSRLELSWSVLSSRMKSTHSPSRVRWCAGAVLKNSALSLPTCVRACSGRSRSCVEHGCRSVSKVWTVRRVRPREALTHEASLDETRGSELVEL